MYIVPTTPCEDADDKFSQGNTAGGVLNLRFSRDFVDTGFQLNLNLLKVNRIYIDDIPEKTSVANSSSSLLNQLKALSACP